MKRLEFVRNIGLIGAGVALAPIQLFSKNSSVKFYKLPEATVHIPHGNFAAAEKEILTIPELDVQLSVEQFMRNGIEECGDDLQVITISKGKESMILCFAENVSQVSGKISGLTLSKSSAQIKIESASSVLEIQTGSNSFQVSRKS